MDKATAVRLRMRVRSLAKQDLSVSEIARRLGVSRLFVRTWKEADDAAEDKRGWKKGKKRTYTDEQEDAVLTARDEVEKGFFSASEPSHKKLKTAFLPTSLSARCANTTRRNHHGRKSAVARNTCSTRHSSSWQSEQS